MRSRRKKWNCGRISGPELESSGFGVDGTRKLKFRVSEVCFPQDSMGSKVHHSQLSKHPFSSRIS